MTDIITPQNEGESTRPPLFFPFITTSPIFDLGMVLLLFPIWWVIGIEQFIWPLGFSLICLKVIIQQKYKIYVSATARWLFLFLIAHLISGFFIVETFRWITFLRNFSTYIAFFCLIIILTNQIKSWRQVEVLLQLYVIIMIVAATIGLLAILEIWQPHFTSLVGRIMPEWIRSTSYGGRIAMRSVGHQSWFVILRNYFRVNSFFLYATLYASALSMAIPSTLFLLHNALKIKWKLFYTVALVVMGINLVYTTGRIAMVSCIAGGLFYLFFFSKWRTATKLLIGFGLIGLSMYILFADAGSVFNDFYQEFVFARGSGSFNSRTTVYRVTLEQFWERPFFGWGTERDIVESVYPAGSHSYYLGILYKQGIMGFLTFLGLLYAIWRETTPVKRIESSKAIISASRFLQYGRWLFVAFVVNSFTDVLELDATTLIFFALVIGLLIKTNFMLKRGQIV